MRSSGERRRARRVHRCLTAPSYASLSPHKSVRRIKPLMRCSALAVGGHHDRGALAALADDLEQQVCTVLVDGEVAELVDDEDGGLQITADVALELAEIGRAHV